MEEHKKEVKEFETLKAEHEKKYLQAEQNLLEAEKTQSPYLPELQKAFKELGKGNINIKQIAEDLKKKEEKTPWNVDTISKPGFSKTVINTKPKPVDETLAGEEQKSSNESFWKEHEKELQHYGMLHRIPEHI